MDERIVQRLEEHLRDAHAANAQLREHVNEHEEEKRVHQARAGQLGELRHQLEQTSLRLKQTDSLTAATTRKTA